LTSIIQISKFLPESANDFSRQATSCMFRNAFEDKLCSGSVAAFSKYLIADSPGVDPFGTITIAPLDIRHSPRLQALCHQDGKLSHRIHKDTPVGNTIISDSITAPGLRSPITKALPSSCRLLAKSSLAEPLS
jgi:hypothetical protein